MSFRLPSFPSSRRRSRRLRKKLHVDEFRELAFAVRFQLRDGASTQDNDAFWADFIALVESRGLAFGGGDSGGFVTTAARGSTSDEDRQALQEWLSRRSGVGAVEVGPLEDAWYGVGLAEG